MMYAIMHRTQVLLEKSQYDTLKCLCERKGLSLSNVVREAVALYLRTGAEKGGAPSLDDIEGIGNDAGATGRGHDAHLYPQRKRR
jgi:hypothetical protein